MRIYISGIQDKNIPDCANYNANYIPNEEFIASLGNSNGNDFFIWAYQAPWGNKGDMSLDKLNKWNNDQLAILSIVKKLKKNVILFDENRLPSTYILSSISDQNCKEKFEEGVQSTQNEFDALYTGLLSVWGKKYLNTLERLDKSPLNFNKKIVQNKNKISSSSEQLELWLQFIKESHENQTRVKSLKKDLNKRFIELAKLTTFQEEKAKAHELELNKLNDEINELKSQKESKNSDLNLTQQQTLSIEIEEKNNHIDSLSKEISLLKETIQNSNKKIDTLTKELNECKQSLNNRYNELAVITGMLEQTKRENLKHKEDLKLHTYNAPSNKDNLSWKMRSPLKGIRNTFGSKKKKAQLIKKSIELIKQSPFFDEKWYLEQNLDVQESKIDPARHYYLFGGFENRDPSSRFSSQGYLDLYSDVRESGMNPLEHYIRFGESEQRSIKSGKYLKN